MSTCNESCSEFHKIDARPQFKNTSVSNRTKLARSKQLCFNCLRTNHSVSARSSKNTSRECKMKHHAFLYRTRNSKQIHPKKTIKTNASSTESEDKPPAAVVLLTAKCHMKANSTTLPPLVRSLVMFHRQQLTFRSVTILTMKYRSVQLLTTALKPLYTRG